MTAGNGRRPAGRLTGLYEPFSWALLRAPLLPANDAVVADDPRIRAAIAEASPDLRQALDRSTVPSSRKAARVQERLLRYVIRMRTRSTPFGLFSGVALVRWGAVTDLTIAAGNPRTRTRPDMGWLSDFIDDLEQDPGIRRLLRLRANEALLTHGGRVFAAGESDEVSVRATRPCVR